MSRRNRLGKLTDRIIQEIRSGRLEEANRSVQLLGSLASNPSVCSQETLDALQEARTLALIHRSHIQRRLRSLASSRLYRAPLDPDRKTWQIDG
jgi:hypothetical protein